jgi:aminoglycoside/choline kinase family phosphotransferase
VTSLTSEQLLARTAARLPHLSGASLAPIEKGGSARRFHRVSAPGGSAVLVHDLGEREENRHYASLAAFLAVHGVPVPSVLAADHDLGLLWLEDLGERDLWASRNESWEVRRPLYESALRGIALLHGIPLSESRRHDLTVQKEFDESLYCWEQKYFADHCLGDLFGVGERARGDLLEDPAMLRMARGLAGRPRAFVHRDFQSQNILVRNGEAVFIDFQGMRPGLAQYDLASLLCDPYVTLTSGERDHLLGFYHGLSPSSSREEFDRVFWQCAAQRLMQALGAYGNLSLNLGKPHFRGHVAPALVNLCEALTRLHPEDSLDALEEILKDLNDPQGDSQGSVTDAKQRPGQPRG